MSNKFFLKKLEINQSVLFGLLSKIWSFCSGPITVVLIAARLSPHEQGYYYTFSTLLALQVFLQLGLGTVISQFASHEWSNLNLNDRGYIIGDNESYSRLASISKLAFKWYFIIGILFFIFVSTFGYIFFLTSNSSNSISWKLPWLALCLMEAISICLVPIWSLLEGCNQVEKLYKFRFYQGIITSITIWSFLIFGLSLWTTTFSALVYIITSLFFIQKNYKFFFVSLVKYKFHNNSKYINWKNEMLPMQWRIALSWISGYFIFSLFVPVLFKYSGSEIAGQMGMTWSLVLALGSVSASWLSPKAPVFGMLIAKKQYEELDRQFWKTTKIIFVVSTIIACAILGFVFFINFMPLPVINKYSSRLLPPLPTTLFLMAQLIYIMSTPFATYLRAHRKEPLMYFSIIYSFFVALSTLLLGKYFSVNGIAWGYLIINILFIPQIYFIWKKKKNIWHTSF